MDNQELARPANAAFVSRPPHRCDKQNKQNLAAVAWQTVNELACGDSGIVHGAKCVRTCVEPVCCDREFLEHWELFS